MRLSVAETNVLREFERRLVGRFAARLEPLVLFGSRARCEGHEDSDLDVLVSIRGVTADERRFVIDQAWELELETALAISPLVRDPGARLGAAIAAEIARDGARL